MKDDSFTRKIIVDTGHLSLPEHLEPELSVLLRPERFYFLRADAETLVIPMNREIESLRRELLYPDIATVLCEPTWEMKWMLAVVGEPKSGYTALLGEPQYEGLPDATQLQANGTLTFEDIRNLIEASSRRPVNSRHKQLPTDLAVAVCDVWSKVLLQTKYSLELQRGCDGTTYHFAYERHGKVPPMTGRTWSPPKQSVPGHMAELAHTLREYVTDPHRSYHLQEKIVNQVQWLKSR
jgi:hypothetical protein